MSFFLHGTNHYEDFRTINFPFFGGNSQLFKKNRHLTRLRFWSFGHARSFSSFFQLAVDPIWRRLYHWVRLGTAGIRDAAAIFSTQSIPVIGPTGKIETLLQALAHLIHMACSHFGFLCS